MTILSWACFAGAGACIILGLGLLVMNKMSYSLIYGHLGIVVGLAITLTAGGIKFGNELSMTQLWMVLAAVVIGYLIFFFGRRRAREEKRFFDALRTAQEKNARGES